MLFFFFKLVLFLESKETDAKSETKLDTEASVAYTSYWVQEILATQDRVIDNILEMFAFICHQCFRSDAGTSACFFFCLFQRLSAVC